MASMPCARCGYLIPDTFDVCRVCKQHKSDSDTSSSSSQIGSAWGYNRIRSNQRIMDAVNRIFHGSKFYASEGTETPPSPVIPLEPDRLKSWTCSKCKEIKWSYTGRDNLWECQNPDCHNVKRFLEDPPPEYLAEYEDALDIKAMVSGHSANLDKDDYRADTRVRPAKLSSKPTTAISDQGTNLENGYSYSNKRLRIGITKLSLMAVSLATGAAISIFVVYDLLPYSARTWIHGIY